MDFSVVFLNLLLTCVLIGVVKLFDNRPMQIVIQTCVQPPINMEPEECILIEAEDEEEDQNSINNDDNVEE